MTVARELATELRKVMRNEGFIYVGSIEPSSDLIPVPRYLVETSAEMLEVLQSQVRTLQTLSDALARMTEEFAKAVPFDHPDIRRLVAQLQAVKNMTVKT